MRHADSGSGRTVDCLLELPLRLDWPLFRLDHAGLCRDFPHNVYELEVRRGAAGGLLIPLKGNAPLLFQFTDKDPFYYLLLGLAASLLLVWKMEGWRMGLYFQAIRENQDAAEALGVDTLKLKMQAMAISAAMTATGGVIYAQYLLFIDPDSTFGTVNSVEIMLRPIIGGPGTILGPLLGSLVLTPLSEITRNAFQAYSGAYLMFYGGMRLVVVVLFLPDGLVRIVPATPALPRKGSGLNDNLRNGLSLANVTESFRGVMAVCSVSLDVRENEIVGLIGPNGAGKTTLFNLISGFLSPDAGTILFAERSLAGLKPNRICRLGLTRTFQIVKPFGHLSVLENVAVGAFNRAASAAEAEEKSWSVLKFIGLDHKALSPAFSLTTPDRKRLELGRAIASSPKLLLLDEVMAGLNPREKEIMSDLIRNIRASGVGVLIIEHAMRVIMGFSDRICVLNFGQCIATGDTASVFSDPKVIAAYIGESTNPGGTSC